MFDPSSVCSNVAPGLDVRVQLAIVSGLTVLATALITLLQTVVQERIRKRQTQKSQAQLPARIADVIESRIESARTSPMPRTSPTPLDQRTTPRDRPPKGTP